MKKFKEIKELVSEVEQDAEKFYDKKNAAAGTRLRKGMQQLKDLAQEVRKEVTAMKNKEK